MRSRDIPSLLIASLLVVGSCADAAQTEADSSEFVQAPDDAVAPAWLPPGTTIEMAAGGRELYAVCSPCHGNTGGGTQLAPALTGPNWIHIDGSMNDIERIVREGVGNPRDYPVPMPEGGGGAFSTDQLSALAVYILSLQFDAD